MLDRFTHTNSKGEILDFVKYGIFIDYNDLRDYDWSVVESNNKIQGFKKEVVKKKLPLVFALNDKFDEIKNAFYEHFEYDVITNKYGYITINDYKFYCYCVGAKKSEYLINNKYLKVGLDIISDNPFWIKENVKTVDFGNVSESSGGMKYPFAYSYSYKIISGFVKNELFVDTDAIIRIYGSIDNPLIKIANNIYQVNVSVKEDEYLEIDTENKTIYKFSKFGTATNIFNYRNKKYDCFKKIPSGLLPISSNGTFKIDIVLIEKRSEPKWISSLQIQDMKNLGTFQMLR